MAIPQAPVKKDIPHSKRDEYVLIAAQPDYSGRLNGIKFSEGRAILNKHTLSKRFERGYEIKEMRGGQLVGTGQFVSPIDHTVELFLRDNPEIQVIAAEDAEGMDLDAEEEAGYDEDGNPLK